MGINSTPKIKFIHIIIAVVVILAIATAVYFYYQYQKVIQKLQNPTSVANEEVQTIISRVGKLMELPTGEVPTLATVSDIEKLKGQSFFTRAKNGDKVLIYTNAKRAILFDPIANKIIDIAPINIGTSSATPTASTTTKVALYNGTSTVGLTQIIEKTLIDKVAGVEVVSKDNAQKKDYAKTLVVDLTGKNDATAKLIAKSLNAEIGQLPAGEDKPVSTSGIIDILVIIGKDLSK